MRDFDLRHNNNQQGRRFGGGGRNNRNGQGGGNSHGHGGGQAHSSSNNGQRRANPRVQTYDSNGPDVRIRGNAIQITEKYMGLARDAAAAGDRVLAESYYQHAEHYQRMLNEAAEEQSRYQQSQPQHQQQQNNGHNNQQPHIDGEGFVQEGLHPSDAPQPQRHSSDDSDGMNDLDQGFLVGPRHTPQQQPALEEQPQSNEAAPAAAPRQRRSFRPKEAETA